MKNYVMYKLFFNQRPGLRRDKSPPSNIQTISKLVYHEHFLVEKMYGTPTAACPLNKHRCSNSHRANFSYKRI